MGRLGLLDPDAEKNLSDLGWNNEESIELLWSLSRSPDADLALRAIVRLRAQLGDEWSEVDRLLRTDKGFRGRLLAVLGSSDALGDHVVAEPGAWRRLIPAELPGTDEINRLMLAAVDAVAEPGEIERGNKIYRAGFSGPKAVVALRAAYRNLVLQVAAHDVASTVEDEPVIWFPEIGALLADLADAALTAALAVAFREVCGDSPIPIRLAVIAMGKCGARELNYVSDVDVVFVSEPADGTAARIAGEMLSLIHI